MIIYINIYVYVYMLDGKTVLSFFLRFVYQTVSRKTVKKRASNVHITYYICLYAEIKLYIAIYNYIYDCTRI